MKQVLIVLLFLQTALFAHDVDVTVSRKVVGINESLSVDFSTEHKIRGNPDFSPIEADFEILSTSQGSATSIVNGSVTSKSSWHLELLPKREGKLDIPAIQFGKFLSEPVAIEVSAALQSSAKENQLYVEAEVRPAENVFEQSQLIYTLRLYYSVNIAQATLGEPKVNDPDALIEKLGDDIQYEQMQNGKKTTVVERKYAVFPQKSGELIFSPVVLEANVIAGRSNSFFNVQTRFKRISSNEVRVNVKPIPAPFHKHDWLAANGVTLKDEWSADPEKIALGEPITWTLTLTAESALASLLPPPAIQLGPEFKQYEDKPVLTNTPNEKGFTAVRQTKIALIANKAGTFTLPEISIKWWDLAENKVRVAKIPSRKLTVLPAALQESLLAGTTVSAVQTEVIPVWAWALIGLNGIWIAALAFWLVKRIPAKENVKSRLKKACLANNAKEAESALLAWALSTNLQKPPLSLISLKRHVSQEMQQPIDDLYSALYGKKNSWEGEALYQAFIAFKPKKETATMKPKEQLLKELYPLSKG